jgi:hypothetical protein
MDLHHVLLFLEEVAALLDADVEANVFQQKHEDMLKSSTQIIKENIDALAQRERTHTYHI